MMRRGFWLITGAVLGVTGYRRVTRLGRMLAGQRPTSLASQRAATLTGPPAREVAPPMRAVAGSPTRAVAGQHRRARPISGLAQAPLALTARTMRPRGATPAHVARVVAAAGFVRDVRNGMAEYWELHRGESARSLESSVADVPAPDVPGPDGPALARQSERTSPALSTQDRRER